MKTITTAIITMLILAWNSSSANFEANFPVVNKNGATSSTVGYIGHVVNNLSTSQSYQMNIVSQNAPSGWAISFCTSTWCAPVGVVTHNFNVAPGDSFYFLMEIHTSSTLGTGTHTVKFENLSTPSGVEEVEFTTTLFSFNESFPLTYKESSTNKDVKMYGNLKNNTNSDISVDYSIIDSDVPADWEVGICYLTDCITSSTASITANMDGQEVSQVQVQFFVGSTEGLGTVTIRMENLANSAEFMERIFTLKTSGFVGIAKAHEDVTALGQNYPNPYNSSTSVQYSLQSSGGQLMITDMLGRTIQNIPLNKKAGKVILGSDLNPGIYLYTLMENGIVKDKKRMQVTH